MPLIILEKTVIDEENKTINCFDCGRQFIEFCSHNGYSKEFKEECLTMYVNGNGFRAIERIKKVNHNTVIRWVREIGNQLPDSPEDYQIPQGASTR